jgi:superfamily II DNA/RNA helicase
MPQEAPTRDQLAADYLEQLPYEPYAVQEEALLAWFTSSEGVLVCAPTGMGKTLIAEAAMYEALFTGATAYYTTPLIALTEQKFHEMQDAAMRWGFSPNEVGLVTGNRRVNPDARILVVVAEILLNRLLHPAAFDFSGVSAVVMDEFHTFNDPERGVVWELTLGLLPPHVRLLLLSATVGNSVEFVNWLYRSHRRKVELVQSSERKVPLTYRWVGDELLTEQLELMARGDEASRLTPALVFCFNREECWSVAEQLKGKSMIDDRRQAQLADELKRYDWSQGAGPKLKQILQRGVGVHHAGVLPKYRRIIEDLFQRKLLSVCVCTETLSAGINLPARSVVLPTIMKGPPDKKRIIEPSSAHQIFGRAGRPQYDSQGYVFVLAHEDDVKLERWRAKFDQIPEDTKDPGLLKAKKALKKKMPRRREGEAYWTESQFEKLRDAPPARLASKGPVPWRLLAYMLKVSPEIKPIRDLVSKRLMDDKRLEQQQKMLNRMLLTLWRAGYVELEPAPPRELHPGVGAKPQAENQADQQNPEQDAMAQAPQLGAFGALLKEAIREPEKVAAKKVKPPSDKDSKGNVDSAEDHAAYEPVFAHPTPALDRLLVFRSVNPLYGVYLLNQLGIADEKERIQAWESVLEMPGSMAWQLRVPPHDELPPGPLATQRLDGELLRLGLASAEELTGPSQEEQEDRRNRSFYEEKPARVLTLAEKLRLLFDFEFPGVHDLFTNPVWAAGEVLDFGGNFNNYVTSKGLQKQEGMVFRHLLRLILLLAEFQQLHPPEVEADVWSAELQSISDRISECCRGVDPTSTDIALEQARHAGEADEGEPLAEQAALQPEPPRQFGEGIF